MRTTVLLNPKPSASKIARKRALRTRRRLTTELIPSGTPLDRAALRACAVPLLVSMLRRWQFDGRIIVVDGVLRVNPKFQQK